MQVEFHASSLAKSPKYNGVPKFQSTSYEQYEDENNYTAKTIGLNSNNQTIEVVHTTYENGRMTREWADYDGDNQPDAVDEWEYDDERNITTWKQDHDGDGLYDCVEKSQYDDHDNMIAWGIDEDMDGEADEINYYSYEYDDDGNITSYSADYDGDGIMDYNQETEYNNEGNPVFKKIDKGNDGFNDEQITYVYNELGGLIDEIHEIFFEDGSSCSYTSIYDGNGNLLTKAMK